MQVFVEFTQEKNPDFKSKAIMNGMGTNYSHVLLRYLNRDGQAKIFEATGEGVGERDYAHFLKTHNIVHSFPMVLHCHPEFFFGYVRGSNGKDYSESQLALIAAGKRQESDGESEMICSELVGRVLTEFSDLVLEGPADSWTPKDLLKALQEKFKV